MSAALASGDAGRLDRALATASVHAAPVEVEEVLVQSYLVLGYPAALRGLRRWRTYRPLPAAARSAADWEGWAEQGAELCRRIYSTQYRRVRRAVRSLHPDMEQWMIVEGYGKVLSRPGLAPLTRELCIAAQLAVVGAEPQLYSHLRGALNLAASTRRVEHVLEVAAPFMDDGRREAAWAIWRQILSRRGATVNGARPGKVEHSSGCPTAPAAEIERPASGGQETG